MSIRVKPLLKRGVLNVIAIAAVSSIFGLKAEQAKKNEVERTANAAVLSGHQSNLIPSNPNPSWPNPSWPNP